MASIQQHGSIWLLHVAAMRARVKEGVQFHNRLRVNTVAAACSPMDAQSGIRVAHSRSLMYLAGYVTNVVH